MLTLDGKGRITVPARWREQLMPDPKVSVELIVAKNPDGCLSLFPLNVWEQFEATVLNLPTQNDAWRRFFVGSAVGSAVG